MYEHLIGNRVDKEVVESSPFFNIPIYMAQEILLKWVQQFQMMIAHPKIFLLPYEKHLHLPLNCKPDYQQK